MAQGDEIYEIIDPGKYTSGCDSSHVTEKSAVILSNEIRGESSVIPRTQILNFRMRRIRLPRCRRFGRDVLPYHACSDGSMAMQQPMKSTLPPCHKVFIYLNPSLIGLVAAKYQGKSEDPFKANPAPSWSCLAAIFVHFLISLTLMQFQSLPTRFLPFLKRVAFASGLVSSLSLISLLLPQFPGLILLFPSWASFAIISGWPKLQSTKSWFLTKIKTVTGVVSSFARKLFSGPIINSQEERAEV